MHHAGAAGPSPGEGDPAPDATTAAASWSHLAVAVPATQVGEHLEVEHPAVVDPVVVVLAAQEQLHRLRAAASQLSSELPSVEAAGRHQALQLESQLGSDRHQLRRLAREVGEPVQGVAPHAAPRSAGRGRRWRSPRGGRPVTRSHRCAAAPAARRTAGPVCHRRLVGPTGGPPSTVPRARPREPSKVVTIRSTTSLPASPFPSATQSRPALLPAHPSQVCRSAPV